MVERDEKEGGGITKGKVILFQNIKTRTLGLISFVSLSPFARSATNLAGIK